MNRHYNRNPYPRNQNRNRLRRRFACQCRPKVKNRYFRWGLMGFTKLFSSIVSSTVWNEDDSTRLLWVTMLAISDRDGLVEASVPGLAHQARISVEKTREGLKRLLAPDPDSRTPDNEGRRVEKVKGGWRILNYEMYREKRNPDDVREKTRLRTQRWRERHKRCDVTNVTVTDVTRGDDIADADADADIETLYRKERVLGGGNHSVNFQKGKNQNPKPQKCMTPDCQNPARTGLPGHAALFCSEACYNAAKRWDTEIK